MQGNEKAIGHDVFTAGPQTTAFITNRTYPQGITINQTFPSRRSDSLAIVAAKTIQFNGPYKLVQGYVAVIGSIPIFISGVDQNETFGERRDISEICDICYNETTRTKLWGLATAAVYWGTLWNEPNSIKSMDAKGYRFNLLARNNTDLSYYSIANSTAGSSIANTTDYNCLVCKGMPRDPVEAQLDIYNNRWNLHLEPNEGWTPSYTSALIAAAVVVILSFVLSILIFFLMVTTARHSLLINCILPRKVIEAIKKVQF